MAAKDKGIKKLEDLGTWSKLKAMDLPSGAKALDSMVAANTKITFAPVAKFTSIRLLVALAAKHSYHVHQADVDSAFVQAKVDPSEAVYMKLPEGMRDLKGYVGYVLKLNKALYGLGIIRLKQTRASTSSHSYIRLYVNYLLLVGPDLEEFQHVKDHLHGLYGIKDLGQANLLLGIRVTFVDGGINLRVRRYLEAMIECFGLMGCKTLSSLMESNLKLTKESGDVDHDLKHWYLQVIGCLMSTTDAEYISLGHMSSDAIHINQHLSELSEGLQHPFPLLGDNTGRITLTKEPPFHNSMKCVRSSEHLTRELVQQKVITVTYIPTSDMARPAYSSSSCLAFSSGTAA
ncbi:hypothetical protein RQP46_002350 [Phenoliferia psychrophenolica]